jgi:riboflavin kinase/FMN adenylyltransferase
MRIIRGLETFPPDAAPSVVALGVFDGVHLGHRAILGGAVARARAAGLRALACTFDPHPLEVLQPERAPTPIATLDERMALVAATGVDATVVIGFSREVAAIEPEAFVRQVLVERLRAREVVVGFNHRFGRGARGDARLLERLGAECGFATHVVAPMMVDDVTVSSSEVRTALGRGDVAAAARLLGRPYTVAGPVVRGAARGRSLGFPTANVAPERPVLVPAGVYAARAEAAGRRLGAVVNIGVRPTFGEKVLAVEAHLLDFTGDLYRARVVLHLVARLREERRFPSVGDLRSQIARDVDAARASL